MAPATSRETRVSATPSARATSESLSNIRLEFYGASALIDECVQAGASALDALRLRVDLFLSGLGEVPCEVVDGLEAGLQAFRDFLENQFVDGDHPLTVSRCADTTKRLMTPPSDHTNANS